MAYRAASTFGGFELLLTYRYVLYTVPYLL